LARLLIALAVLLLAAHGVGALFARFKQPPAVGEIVGGLLLGPSALGAAFPAVQHWIFPSTGPAAAALGAVYQLGLLLLMFAAGAEMRRLLQRDAVRPVGLIAAFGLIVPFAAGLALVGVLGTGSFIGTAGNKAALTLVFGMAVAVTSIPVITRIMHDVGLLGTRFSRIVLSVAVIEDIVLYVILAVAVGLVSTTSSSAFGIPAVLHLHSVVQNSVYHTIAALVFLAAALTVGGRLYRALTRMRFNALARRSPVAFQLMWMLALSAGALALGIVPLYGAFVAGITVAVAQDGEVVKERNSLAGISFGFFIPVYFAIIGLQLDLIHHFDVLFFLGFLATACVAKAASVYAGARLSRENTFMSASLAIAMNARGGPGIVLASTAYAAGIINQTFFVSLVMLSVITSLLAGSWLERVADRLAGAGGRPAPGTAELAVAEGEGTEGTADGSTGPLAAPVAAADTELDGPAHQPAP
jgi:Kef-type K+ transport system membrane component KefB